MNSNGMQTSRLKVFQLYKGIMKVKHLLSQNIIPKPAFYLFCDAQAVLVRHR